MNAASDHSKLPDPQAADLARESAAALAKLLKAHPRQDRARVRMDDTDLVLPLQALELLRNILTEMAQGNAVTIMPVHAELTTQEAANLLNVSRPHLVKLLEDGAIPFSKVGTHRRIRFQDVMEYRAARNSESEAALQALADQAQEHDMGY
ncbi:helix-turn-helix domain-containing protein [Alloalcanivorax marinus]|uniref:helix-turn-helix domain-containing protein n=1 Tax=Alloalcanivorax marinus TaxID=1177169 RepID=UPI0021CE1371|nr:helix-turn-helix domain-containing protein [Alloalcanivorax marinus]MCU5787656.1 putative plasmid-related excisionase [Alloalcanivorax marinus]